MKRKKLTNEQLTEYAEGILNTAVLGRKNNPMDDVIEEVIGDGNYGYDGLFLSGLVIAKFNEDNEIIGLDLDYITSYDTNENDWAISTADKQRIVDRINALVQIRKNLPKWS